MSSVNVLVVDDSLFMRAAIKKTLEANGFTVIGQAKNGRDAVDKALALEPDVITMDYNMPELNGAEAVREIMAKRPTPIIMFSAHTRQGARETFEALAAGAVDFVTKPSGEVSADLSKISDELVRKLTAASGSRPRAITPIQARKPPRPVAHATLPPTGPRIVVIGISTGGPAALSRVIPALPPDIRFAVIVVQHMPAKFTAALAERLDSISAVHVREAREGDRPLPGTVLIAPGNKHTEVDAQGRLYLTDGPPVNGCRPAVDVTMKSAARAYGRRTIGVIMTGMGKDGAEGMVAIKAADGKTMAQNEDTCVIYGMPRAAIEAGVVDDIVALDDIPGRLRYL